jgi:hypothetical protein
LFCCASSEVAVVICILGTPTVGCQEVATADDEYLARIASY